jgi:hypothetical protein
MIHEICACPYCGEACGLDDETHALIFEGGKPCRHCAFVSAGIDAYRGRHLVQGRSCFLSWERGRGLRAIDPSGPPDPLDGYVQMLATNIIPGQSPLMSPEDLPAGVEYEIAGGTSTEREKVRRGSGDFPLADRRGNVLSASLDGWGVYARDPDGVAAAVRERALR